MAYHRKPYSFHRVYSSISSTIAETDKLVLTNGYTNMTALWIAHSVVRHDMLRLAADCMMPFLRMAGQWAFRTIISRIIFEAPFNIHQFHIHEKKISWINSAIWQKNPAFGV